MWIGRGAPARTRRDAAQSPAPPPHDLDRRAVLQDRLTAADLLQGKLAAFVAQLLEAVEAVPAVAHHLAGLADVAELPGQFQQSDLRSDDLLLLCHRVSLTPQGGPRSRHL